MSRPKFPDERAKRGVIEAVAILGYNFQRARRSIPLREIDVAHIACVSRNTVRAVENGLLGTSMGNYAAVLSTLGIERELRLVGLPKDERGRPQWRMDLVMDPALRRRVRERIEASEEDW